MAISEAQDFDQMLVRLSEDIIGDNLQTMKFLCDNKLGDAVLDRIKEPLDLFKKLKIKKEISENNGDFLFYLLENCQLILLKSQVENWYKFHSKRGTTSPSQPTSGNQGLTTINSVGAAQKGGQSEQSGGGPTNVFNIGNVYGDIQPSQNTHHGDRNIGAIGGGDSHVTNYPGGQIIEQLDQHLKIAEKRLLENIEKDVESLTKEQRIQAKLKSVNFEKGFNSHVPVSHIRFLADLSESVGLIINEHCQGSGFRLGSQYFLTTLHVVLTMVQRQAEFLENIENVEFPSTIKIKVDFNFEKAGVDDINYIKCTKFIICNRALDYCLLQLDSSKLLPPGLDRHISEIPNEIEFLSIVGHPNGETKSVDARCHIPTTKDWNYITTFGCNDISPLEPKIVSYETDMKWGSSGSPVITNKGKLVAMHTRGSRFDDKYQLSTSTDFIIEHGYSMQVIKEDLKTRLPENLFNDIFLPQASSNPFNPFKV